MSDAGTVPKPAWVEVHLKQMDIASSHLLEQHRRLQQEIYVRLRSRLALINYAIGSIGGLAGIVTFLLRPQIFSPPQHGSTPVDGDTLLVISAILYLGAFVFIFFLLNFLSHSGYIYAASRLIRERFPSILRDLEERCYAIARELKSPPHLPMDKFSDRIFTWEDYITEKRRKVQFTDSKFEIWSFIALSITSFLLHLGFFEAFRESSSRSESLGSILNGPAMQMLLAVSVALYAGALAYSFVVRYQVMKFRDEEFKEVAEPPLDLDRASRADKSGKKRVSQGGGGAAGPQ